MSRIDLSVLASSVTEGSVDAPASRPWQKAAKRKRKVRDDVKREGRQRKDGDASKQSRDSDEAVLLLLKQLSLAS